jgi:hypothetical protein
MSTVQAVWLGVMLALTPSLLVMLLMTWPSGPQRGE